MNTLKNLSLFCAASLLSISTFAADPAALSTQAQATPPAILVFDKPADEDTTHPLSHPALAAIPSEKRSRAYTWIRVRPDEKIGFYGNHKMNWAGFVLKQVKDFPNRYPKNAQEMPLDCLVEMPRATVNKLLTENNMSPLHPEVSTLLLVANKVAFDFAQKYPKEHTIKPNLDVSLLD